MIFKATKYCPRTSHYNTWLCDSYLNMWVLMWRPRMRTYRIQVSYVTHTLDWHCVCSKLKRDSSPNFENLVQTDQLLQEKDAEVRVIWWRRIVRRISLRATLAVACQSLVDPVHFWKWNRQRCDVFLTELTITWTFSQCRMVIGKMYNHVVSTVKLA